MTKEEALKKIEELKEYVEKCEEKEKEIPEIPHRGDYNIHLVVSDKSRDPYSSWDGAFENPESANLYNILAFELAQLVYARGYLKVDSEDLLKARRYGEAVFRVVFVIVDLKYAVTPIKASDPTYESDRIWCFTDRQDAQRVCDYMNKYVKDVKKNMY